MAEKKKGKANPPSKAFQSWLDDVAAYERAFKKWEGRVEKILKRYRDDPRTGQRQWTTAKFNLLWSNVQTLSSATFARLPKPDVARAFKDNDPVGRVAALILERALDYHIQHYPSYKETLKQNILDRFLGGRGTAWVRYEPHILATQKAQPIDGDQVTEDVDTPDEELDYECVSVDFVHYKDFGHTVSRTWEEVPRVWRRVYMTKEALEKRFGEEKAKEIPMDADPRQMRPNDQYGGLEPDSRATIYEGWDKEKREAVWFSKSMKDFIEVKQSPVDFEEGFPCPKPLYSSLTNESLEPIPDFVIYQDQANELDILADRIDGLIKALKVAGGYDSSIPEIGRIFTEAENGTLIPIKNWAAFAEKNGLQGALSLVDLKPIADALKTAYEAFFMVKRQADELIGIADIMRGETEASETATAQRIKAQYGGLRLKSYQAEVARYATDTLRLMSQVICTKFLPDTIAKIGNAENLEQSDLECVPAALELLVGKERIQNPESNGGPNPVRNFRIDIAADSMVYLDEESEKQSRVEFLGAVGTYLQNVAKATSGMPREVAAVLVPLLMDMLQFGVRGYPVGKTIEGAFAVAAQQLKQIAATPQQPQTPPEVQMEQIRQQAENAREQARQQMDIKKTENDVILQRAKHASDQQLQREKIAGEMQLERERMQMEDMWDQRKQEREERQHQAEIAAGKFDRPKPPTH